MWQLKVDNQVFNFETKQKAEERAIAMILQEYKDVEGDIICNEEDDTRFDDLLNDPNICINWNVLLPRFKKELESGQCRGIGGYSLYIVTTI